MAADGFDASDLEFSKLAAKNCNLNLKLLRPDADELADAARKTADILGNFNDIEIRNATVMYVLLSNAKKLGMQQGYIHAGGSENDGADNAKRTGLKDGRRSLRRACF